MAETPENAFGPLDSGWPLARSGAEEGLPAPLRAGLEAGRRPEACPTGAK